MIYMAYADVLRPAVRRYAFLYDLGLVIAGSLLVALSAQVAIPLPSSPVPLTGQTLVVLLVGVVLGSRRGAICMLTYLGEGIIGWPVFAGGQFGWMHLLGPTGGYLVGFVVAAYISGLLAERGWDRRLRTSLLAMVSGNLVIYLFGLVWLGRFVGTDQAVALGVLPFLPGDLVKIGLGTWLLPTGWRLLGRH